MWAPNTEKCSLHIVDPEDRVFEMQQLPDGYYAIGPVPYGSGTQYFFSLSNVVDRPDPASRSQPRGVHGPSMVVDGQPLPRWSGLDLQEYVIYELHIGTFTEQGTFEAVIPELDRLRSLGITALEVMPVAEFPGERNWGYDGTCPFAAEHSYGGVEGLRRLVRACHDRGIAFILDVVYNHLGPEGNYLRDFGPYFTARHKTPWGDALNFDGPCSDHVRRYFIENALWWMEDCGVDALRLDAVHAIHDESAHPFLQELAERVHERRLEQGRPLYLIAESDLNDARLITPTGLGGLGIDAQWADDFHHSLHTLLTGDLAGYYADFGSIDHLVKAFQEGWVYTGQYSTVRQRQFGNSPAHLDLHQLIICTQNHDQVGNRMQGERLIHLAGWDAARLAAAAVILSLCTPMLFMGEEYGEPAPFLYFVSHSDPDLQQAVQLGRKAEFAHFIHQGDPPDPQNEQTFLRSKLNTALAGEGRHAQLHAWYSRLFEVRLDHPALRERSRSSMAVESFEKEQVILIRRFNSESQALIFLAFASEPREVSPWVPAGEWRKLIDSTDHEWGGQGSQVPSTLSARGERLGLPLPPTSCVVFVQG